jgi:hypothetical protein
MDKAAHERDEFEQFLRSIESVDTTRDDERSDAARLAGSYEMLVADLQEHLDLDAGLADVFARAESADSPGRRAPAGSLSTCSDLVDSVSAATPAARLRIRRRVLKLIDMLDYISGRDFEVVHARRILIPLRDAQTHVRNLTVDLQLNNTSALVRAYRNAESLSGVLGHALTRAHEENTNLMQQDARGRALDVARGRTLDLSRRRSQVKELRRALEPDRVADLKHGAALRVATDVARDLTREINDTDHDERALRRAQDDASDLVRSIAIDLGLGSWGVLDLSRQTFDQAEIARLGKAVNDLVDADLSDADLHGHYLDGVQWSARTTRWPSDWREEIALVSVCLHDDIFEVRIDTTTFDDRMVSTHED